MASSSSGSSPLTPPPALTACVHHECSHGPAGEGAREAVQGPAGAGRWPLRAAAVASFVAAVLAEIYLCDVGSGQEILSQGLGQGQGQGWQRRATELGAELAVAVSAAAAVAGARGGVAPA
eukprot:COSAG01_NODE_2170_length_8236_cov_17.597272_11_plen_120_part_01